jgi:phosphoribosylaminoimidazole carboxylase (NCAIR synthetase)
MSNGWVSSKWAEVAETRRLTKAEIAEWKAEFLEQLKTLGQPKPKPAEVLAFPDKLREQELMRRQAVIDAQWQRNLDAKDELERQFGRGFHRGYGED